MLGRMLIYAMLMIIAAGLTFGGIMMLTVAPEPKLAISVPFVVGGPIVALYSLRQVLILNRRFQHEAWEAAIADPSSIYARWTDAEGRELLLAKSGLFIEKNYHAFAESYSRLSSIRIDGGTLHIELEVGPSSEALTQTKQVDVPESVRSEVEAAVDELRAAG